MARRSLQGGGAVPMDPGERDKFVTIEALNQTLGPSRFPVEEWVPMDAVWMRKDDLRGPERFQAMQLTAPFDTRWEMGYRADMDPELVDVPKMRRLLYQGRVYDIVEAHQIGRREGVELQTLHKAS